MDITTNISCHHDDPYPESQAIIRLYLIGPLTVFGMLSNILNLLVFSQKSMMISPINCFLLVLSAFDFTTLICTFFMLSFPVLAERSKTKGPMYAAAVLTRWLFPISQTAQTCSVYMTVVVGVNRFLGVCHPLKARRWTSSKSARLSMMFVVVFGLVFNLSRWLEVTTARCWSNLFNATSLIIVTTPLRANENYVKWYNAWSYITIMFALPFTILITVNLMISRALRKSRHLRAGTTYNKSPSLATPEQTPQLHRSKINGKRLQYRKRSARETLMGKSVFEMNRERERHRKEFSVTVMLMAVVGLFLVCNCLPFINNLLELVLIYNPEWANASWLSAYLVLVEIGNLLVVTNCSSNVVIYWLCSTKYRQVIWSMVESCKSDRTRVQKQTMVSNGTYKTNSKFRNTTLRTFRTRSFNSRSRGASPNLLHSKTSHHDMLPLDGYVRKASLVTYQLSSPHVLTKSRTQVASTNVQ